MQYYNKFFVQFCPMLKKDKIVANGGRPILAATAVNCKYWLLTTNGHSNNKRVKALNVDKLAWNARRICFVLTNKQSLLS